MTISEIFAKTKNKLRFKLVKNTRKTALYPFLYRSYWHYLLHKNVTVKNTTCYYSARPNPGAGIGHQLANWIAGFWYASQFELKFAHLPFSNSKWESFLGLGEKEKTVSALIRNGYKSRKLPLFDSDNKKEVDLNKAIIKSYAGRKVVFIAEQDQFYMEQYEVSADLNRKFNDCDARKSDSIKYKSDRFNIAVHVRRTVVIDGKIILENDAAKSLRWLQNDYYEKVLSLVLNNIEVSKPISIYIFSTGKSEEFSEFSKHGDVHFCSDMNEYDSFLHLVKADLLITSKSSFSYKPALINDGIKICPRNFWHGYPDKPDWVLVENDGTFDSEKLRKIIWKK